MSGATFLGYGRPDGAVGVRNHVAVVSVMDNCNPVTRRVAEAVYGTIPVTTLFVRGQLGRDLDITLDTLAGLARNPNVAAVLLIGLEAAMTEALAKRIRPCGKTVAAVVIQEVGGTINAVAEATRAAARLVREASRQRRAPFALSKLVIGVECGGSDTTSGLASNPSIGVVADRLVGEGGTVIISETSEFFGAEHLFAERARDARVKAEFLEAVQGFEREIMAHGIDLRGSNPTPDNILGGLTTIEEKALGAMAKAGKSPLNGVLAYGEAPREKGLNFMATPAPAVESLTALAAGGCQICLFSTGVGNPIGSMVSTTIKVSGNRNTIDAFADNVDFDVTGVLERGEPLMEAGGRLADYMVSVASGELTSSEILDVRETCISRFLPSM
ncbi:UxaA family hydrolase [Xanthobacter sp. KR7-225]|uniref:UxaA family hydrolase n=1 Tax=Xanthobacter sp. KR7-225 TaxID=3156613 RepID=UPI0032B56C4B